LTTKEVLVPNIGADGVDVIELLVNVGDKVEVDDSLIVLESDKATMEVPAPFAGVVKSISVKLNDKISEGDLILALDVAAAGAETPSEPTKEAAKAPPAPEKKTAPATSDVVVPKTVAASSSSVHAGPAVRRLANDLGVDLQSVTGTGAKGRIVKSDVTQFVKTNLHSGAPSGAGLPFAPAPAIDFSKFGEIDFSPLSRIQKISGAHLHRNWMSIPHITQFEDADITALEAFRQANKIIADGVKLTPIVFIMKAVVASLKAFPTFNASLDSSGTNLILKKYFHIGVAVDTPNGLVVPVIRDVDKKGMVELATELAQLSKKARAGKLMPMDMQGGCFTISSLGGIGGTAFTPIINAPEVAILGVSKSAIKAQFIEGEFKPRLMLPLCLSYDHRVIDGANGARFIVHLSKGLSNLPRLLL
jgi:pyruvate dehydrogenase E2 component (dihydrolipoamide acetyltransferase)